MTHNSSIYPSFQIVVYTEKMKEHCLRAGSRGQTTVIKIKGQDDTPRCFRQESDALERMSLLPAMLIPLILY